LYEKVHELVRIKLDDTSIFELSCVIPGFRRKVNEIFALLGCYAA